MTRRDPFSRSDSTTCVVSQNLVDERKKTDYVTSQVRVSETVDEVRCGWWREGFHPHSCCATPTSIQSTWRMNFPDCQAAHFSVPSTSATIPQPLRSPIRKPIPTQPCRLQLRIISSLPPLLVRPTPQRYAAEPVSAPLDIHALCGLHWSKCYSSSSSAAR